MNKKTAQFRFYAELNDFLAPEARHTTFPYLFAGTPSVKDAIEAIGIPHPEVDLVLVNGVSVGFDYRLRADDRVSVYPVFESLDISPVVHLRPRPLRETQFVLDGHLGRLARRLRMLGFDTLYRRDFDDAEIVRISGEEGRVILTRDVGLLKANAVTHGYWIRSQSPPEQVHEVLARFDLYRQMRPFQRCIVCNATISPVARSEVEAQLPAKVKELHDEFYRCTGCRKVYWKGTHYRDMVDRIRGYAAPGHTTDAHKA